MAHVLITGGRGTLGSALAPLLQTTGHQVSVTSRTAGPGVRQLDLATGEGLETALEGIDVVVHAATNPLKGKAVDVQGTERLLAAMKETGTARLVYPSIVGVDRHPFPYYRVKYAVEQMIEASAVPFTTVRITQFHDLIDMSLRGLTRLPVVPVAAGFVFQPIATEEAAAETATWVDADPAGMAPDVGGPEVRRFTDLVKAWLQAKGKRRLRVPILVPGRSARAFRQGVHTCPDRAVGTVTWEEFLARS